MLIKNVRRLFVFDNFFDMLFIILKNKDVHIFCLVKHVINVKSDFHNSAKKFYLNLSDLFSSIKILYMCCIIGFLKI